MTTIRVIISTSVLHVVKRATVGLGVIILTSPIAFTPPPPVPASDIVAETSPGRNNTKQVRTRLGVSGQLLVT